MTNQRPREGVDAETALRLWSDTSAYQAMMEFSDAARIWSAADAGQRNREYRKRRKVVEDPFIERLKCGTLVASAIEKYSRRREVIEPSLWDVLEIDFDLDEVAGGGHIFEKVEYFEPSEIPSNIVDPPNWLSTNSPALEFRHERDYRVVTMRGQEFHLGEKQALVIRFLHEASLRGDPWQEGKVILGKADSQLERIRDLFKSQKAWKELIKSDGKSRYRLNLREV